MTFAPAISYKLIALPTKKLASAAFPKLALSESILPLTLNPVSVPTDVIFGCAAVVTVAAVFAEFAACLEGHPSLRIAT